jgi:hypothetical protein
MQARSSLLGKALVSSVSIHPIRLLCCRQHVLVSATTQQAGVSGSSREGRTERNSLQPAVAAAATAQVADVSSKRSAGKSLMIVESPTKAVKIQKFLGDQYKVSQRRLQQNV